MREIKFSIWLPGISKMTYYHTIEELMNWGTKEWMNGTAVFLQYTGLKDRNGKEIYEGDIATVKKYGKKVVSFEDGMFKLGTMSLCTFTNVGTDYRCEVIGNIYENPELVDL